MKTFLVVIPLFIVLGLSAPGHAEVQDCDLHQVDQTSADMLYEYSKCLVAKPAQAGVKHNKAKHLLLADIYIKAWSYAWMNKAFFVLSMCFAGLVLIWPSAVIIAGSRIEDRPGLHWLRSPTLQTTITAVAALMFALYADYKSKQTQAETLMRYTLFSNEEPEKLGQKVADELARIDRGFSFKSVFDKSADDGPI